eukprot:352454-Chlamydomonas_euryale.AAC.13
MAAQVLTPVTDASSVALAVHVTSDEGWRAIQVRSAPHQLAWLSRGTGQPAPQTLQSFAWTLSRA